MNQKAVRFEKYYYFGPILRQFYCKKIRTGEVIFFSYY